MELAQAAADAAKTAPGRVTTEANAALDSAVAELNAMTELSNRLTNMLGPKR